MVVQTDLQGPFPLTQRDIDSRVRPTLGVYVLGHHIDVNNLTVKYVGRSDDDVHGRLSKWAATGEYAYFMFKHVDSVLAGFEQECRLYHALDNLDNKVHPDRPDGTMYHCPVCNHPPGN
jgi:hypothetical protein